VTVDHAIVDGAPAARFAATLADLIEHPSWIDPGYAGGDLGPCPTRVVVLHDEPKADEGLQGYGNDK
jgi:hypothetical protein